MQERLDKYCLDNDIICFDKYDKAKTHMKWKCNICLLSMLKTWDMISKSPHNCIK